jgi:hypothetical protein
MSPVGFRVNLYAPWLVPIAIASASSCVRLTKSAACSGSVRSWLARHRRLGAVAVFLVAAHRLERAEAAELALDGDAARVRHVDDLAGDVDVVVVRGDRLAVGLERAVHHHRREAEVDRAPADVGALAVVLVHDQRHLRPRLDRRLDQVLDEGLAGVLAGAGAGLQDDRRADLVGGAHHRLDLLEVVDVEGGDAIAVVGGMVEQLAHGDERHGSVLFEAVIGCASAQAITVASRKRPCALLVVAAEDPAEHAADGAGAEERALLARAAALRRRGEDARRRGARTAGSAATPSRPGDLGEEQALAAEERRLDLADVLDLEADARRQRDDAAGVDEERLARPSARASAPCRRRARRRGRRRRAAA